MTTVMTTQIQQIPMLDDFLIRAALAGIGLALAAGPLGCFVVWRRMAYFGDATAHAAILGVALSLAFSLSLFVGVLVAALAMSLGVLALAGRIYTMDTLLGVAAHGALALGLVAVSFLPGVRVDLMAYLFGDILAVSQLDLAVIWIGAVVVLILLRLRWQALLLVTLNTDLAAARGYDARREQLILTLALAVLVAVAIKIVGALLITAMLIIPAAAARSMSRTPESMAVIAAIVGLCSIISGLSTSFYWNTPTGPTMIVAAIVLFVLASLWSVVNRSR
jgi:zinc transport system permease protein